MSGHLLFIEYEGGPLAGRDEAVKALPPTITEAGITYYPTGRVNARGRHVYTIQKGTP